MSLVDIDLSTRLVLDTIDGRTGFTDNLSDTLGRNGELEFLPGLVLESSSFEQLGLGSSDALFTTSDRDLVRLGSGGSVLVVSGERELDAVLLFESDGILSTRTDERRLNGSFDVDRFGRLVLELFDLCLESLLGLFDGFLSTDNLYVSTEASRAKRLDLPCMGLVYRPFCHHRQS